MASLAEIRARLQASENKGGNDQRGGDRGIYPHWNMEEGNSCVVRFLPDGNSKNTFFWVGHGVSGCARHGFVLGCWSKRDREKKSLIRGRRNKSMMQLQSINQNYRY